MAGIGKRLLATTLVLVLGLVLLPLNSFAASTGQIKGKITDKDTGEPIPGVSVLVVGTVFGAATDPDGEFAILRLEPATYTLRISHIDYNTVQVEDVEVQPRRGRGVVERRPDQVGTLRDLDVRDVVEQRRAVHFDRR